MKSHLVIVLTGIFIITLLIGCNPKQQQPAKIGVAVEFNNHAASAFISREKGWFEQEGLNIATYENYITGMALASALARGDIEVAYICLAPAINAYINAGVPIKIIAGTHKYGYGVIAVPQKVNNFQDLEKPGMKIGCVQAGGPVDILLHKTIDYYHLDKAKVLNNVQRMNPPKMLLALKSGQLDVAFLPEHWATLGEAMGFKMLLTAKDIWNEMQGSVLVVKDDLINNNPEIANKLVKITQKATDWCHQHPQEAAEIMAKQLSIIDENLYPKEAAEAVSNFEITPKIMLNAMAKLEYTTTINDVTVQKTIDYIYKLGYIKNTFNADEILDLRFLNK